MFQQFLTGPYRRQVIGLSALFGVIGLLVFFSTLHPVSPMPAQTTATTGSKSVTEPSEEPMPRLQEQQAREYLQHRGEYESLMQAASGELFDLKRYEINPLDGSDTSGYLAMSHVQNLNAWFDDQGITIRPTVAEKDRDKSWRLGFKLKAYGYGEQVTEAPPIVSRAVKENRIEYRHSPMVEWYENRAAGIEQGFTVNAPPARAMVPSTEPLRLLVKVEGDLHACTQPDGRALLLLKADNEAVLSYGQLRAKDARGKELPARMETDSEGNQIALIVEDAGATYPIDIDPITATQEQKVTDPITHLTGGEFGDAVAIDGDTAIIGEWLMDEPGLRDDGEVIVFTRMSGSWTLKESVHLGFASSEQCGYSVAISGNNIVFGCPGADVGAGLAIVHILDGGPRRSFLGDTPGGRFGSSVAILNLEVLIGGPSANYAKYFALDSGLNPLQSQRFDGIGSSDGFGASVALSESILAIGAPNAGSPYVMAGVSRAAPVALFPNSGDSSAVDEFGYSLAASGKTLVVGAPLDNNPRGRDAGAAYVFVSDFNGHWSQQQKLIASDGIDDDRFGYSVAINGNAIAVGSPYFGSKTFAGIRGNGRSYVFTRNINVWTEQVIVSALFEGAPGDRFGTGVAISGDTLISGAEHATVNGVSDSGAAFVHRLSCVPPSSSFAVTGISPNFSSSATVCLGSNIDISVSTRNPTNAPLSFQWRKNGANISGATAQKLTITNTSASDAGSYDAIVTNSCGAEISQPFTLAINTFSINPTSQNFGAAGSNGVVNITDSATCGWAAQSNAPWISIVGNTIGFGSSTVNFKVDPNPTASPRSGTMTIAGQTFTVTQDGAPPPPNAVQFSAANYNVLEDCTTLTITVNRSGDISAPASVDYATSDGTATERKDYITALGRLNFAAGEAAKSFTVLINEDSTVEGNEIFNLTLSNASGATLGAQIMATVTIIDDPSEPATNTIDDPQSFVCQHYHDFLNRQPDASGLAFWTGNITSCGADANCIQVKRINVSGAFYLSIEFQQTGYLVERLYKTAFGDATQTSTLGGAHNLAVPIVRLNEFLFDSQKIGQNVIVGQAGWETQLENNKQAFVAEFSGRARFTAAFPAGMNAAQFVDTLNGHAGNPLAGAERDQLVNDLSSGAKSRAQVLRAVAEHPNLVRAEFNRAFVLMQFFGYLRRNPNDPQDTDYTGYDFWLTKLNQFNGNYINAEMVKAFINSGEYRQRFGP